ncbi:MAG: hypothetical protein EOO99_04195 [Pedobacter sp.]|nr:MAG: hypothetical protein EOO99_04195 [Pedobacter sp.]
MYSLGIALFGYALPDLFPDTPIISPAFWLIYAFLGGVTLIAYFLVILGMKINPETSILAIMASIGIKMFFALAFILIYRAKTGGMDLLFVINFFSLYLLFTLFEISALLRNLRHQNK